MRKENAPDRQRYPSKEKLHLKGTKLYERYPFIPSMSISDGIDLLNIFNLRGYAVDCKGKRVTYGQFIKDSKVLAKAFAALGVRQGEIVIITTPNIYQAVVCFKALNKIGAITTFLNEFIEMDELKKYIEHFSSPMVINYNKDIEYNQTLLNHSKLKNIVTISENNALEYNL